MGLHDLLSMNRDHLYVFPLQSRRYDSRTTIFSPEGKTEIVHNQSPIKKKLKCLTFRGESRNVYYSC